MWCVVALNEAALVVMNRDLAEVEPQRIITSGSQWGATMVYPMRKLPRCVSRWKKPYNILCPVRYGVWHRLSRCRKKLGRLNLDHGQPHDHIWEGKYSTHREVIQLSSTEEKSPKQIIAFRKILYKRRKRQLLDTNNRKQSNTSVVKADMKNAGRLTIFLVSIGFCQPRSDDYPSRLSPVRSSPKFVFRPSPRFSKQDPIES